jgi:hypothetical protein
MGSPFGILLGGEATAAADTGCGCPAAEISIVTVPA